MHFLQSREWREIKTKLGNKTYEVGDYFFQTTKLPLINKYIGYMPRVDLKKIDFTLLFEEAVKANCVYVVIDPANLMLEIPNSKSEIQNKLQNLNSNIQIDDGVPVHLQQNTIIDLTKTEEELLAAMKQKHRYNLKLAQKKGVEVKIDRSNKSFEEFLRLYKETETRQGYSGRSELNLRTVWEVTEKSNSENELVVLIATAYYENQPLVSWMLFLYEDTISYPYGGSSDLNKNVMAPYALLWEIVKWGKVNGYKKFDTYGIKPSAVSGQPSAEPEYQGYSRFKVGFGAEIINYANTINIITDPLLYPIVKFAYKLRNKIRFRS